MNAQPEHQLRRRRLDGAMTLSQLAALAECDKGHLSKIENWRLMPSHDLMVRLCRLLPGLEPNDFFAEFAEAHQ